MLSWNSHRGFTLVELVVATALLLIVSGALSQLLLITERLSRSQAQHLRLQSEVRNAALVAINELRELSTAQAQGSEDNDILSATSSSISYRASRGFGVTCQPSTATQLRVARADFTGARDPEPGRDSAFIWIGGDPATEDDDRWQPVAITAVSAGTCGASTVPALTLTVPSTAALAGAAGGTPVRIYEVMELRLYQSAGQSWLGMRAIGSGEAIQPLAGPLTSDGLQLELLDAGGRVTSDPTAVQSIRALVRGVAEGLTDSLETEVALRNRAAP
jgi:prepilin-type N-terminal cleavage/methylation domain-containing protein